MHPFTTRRPDYKRACRGKLYKGVELNSPLTLLLLLYTHADTDYNSLT